VILAGINVGSRQSFIRMNRFIDDHEIRPPLRNRLGFDQLPQALGLMATQGHFGKIVLTA
jgi:NADPH:quinone reductase-like Zn-dependent oxidoreductase